MAEANSDSPETESDFISFQSSSIRASISNTAPLPYLAGGKRVRIQSGRPFRGGRRNFRGRGNRPWQGRMYHQQPQGHHSGPELSNYGMTNYQHRPWIQQEQSWSATPTTERQNTGWGQSAGSNIRSYYNPRIVENPWRFLEKWHKSDLDSSSENPSPSSSDRANPATVSEESHHGDQVSQNQTELQTPQPLSM